MNENDRDRAAEFVLGLLSAHERARLARAADSDPMLAGEIARWEEALAPLQSSNGVAPPQDMFERIQDAIATRSRHLPGT